jgi:hypothetical protein
MKASNLLSSATTGMRSLRKGAEKSAVIKLMDSVHTHKTKTEIKKMFPIGTKRNIKIESFEEYLRRKYGSVKKSKSSHWHID